MRVCGVGRCQCCGSEYDISAPALPLPFELEPSLKSGSLSGGEGSGGGAWVASASI